MALPAGNRLQLKRNDPRRRTRLLVSGHPISKFRAGRGPTSRSCQSTSQSLAGPTNRTAATRADPQGQGCHSSTLNGCPGLAGSGRLIPSPRLSRGQGRTQDPQTGARSGTTTGRPLCSGTAWATGRYMDAFAGSWAEVGAVHVRELRSTAGPGRLTSLTQVAQEASALALPEPGRQQPTSPQASLAAQASTTSRGGGSIHPPDQVLVAQAAWCQPAHWAGAHQGHQNLAAGRQVSAKRPTFSGGSPYLNSPPS